MDEGFQGMAATLTRIADALELIAKYQLWKNEMLSESVAKQQSALDIQQMTADALLGPHE
jgi:hypothetical protein